MRDGRFGRAAPATDDAPVADASTTMTADGGDEREDGVRYVVDPEAVAAAILDRLVAGRTLPPPREPRAG